MHGCETYLDDIVIYSSTWSNHLKQNKKLFNCLTVVNLTINWAKCEFGKTRVTYLNKVVGGGQVQSVMAKVEVICDFPVPENCRELRIFLGIVGYYRGFCKNFATVVAPLTHLLSPKVSFQWSVKCQEAFDNAKALLASAPILLAPNFDLAADTSKSGAGAVCYSWVQIELRIRSANFLKRLILTGRHILLLSERH